MRQTPAKLVSSALLLISSLLSLNVFASDLSENTHNYMPVQGTPFYQNFFATAESLSNLGGGIQNGTEFNSLAYTKFAMNSSAIGLPEGGRFRASALLIASEQAGANLVGDFQGVSNIEAPANALLYDFWYRQDFSSSPLQLRIGIIDMNEYFDVTDSAANLINSSFGVGAGLSANASLSIYPKPGYAMMARYGSASSRILLGVFSAQPADRSSPFHAGRFSVAEWQQSVASTSNFKLGAWQCDCSADPAILPRMNTYGVYGSFEHQLESIKASPDTLFLRFASSHGATTIVPGSFGVGINAPGFFKSRPDDVFSAGVTRARFDNHPAETSYELTYLWQLNSSISLQPDYQFIRHPDGSLPDAHVFILRLTSSYDTHFMSSGT